MTYAARRRNTQPPTPARQAAQDLMRMIINQGQTLQEALDKHETWGILADRDRRFTRRLITMTLRNYGAAKEILNAHIEKPIPKKDYKAQSILIMAIVEILWAQNHSHAAVDQAVKLIRRAGFKHLASFANGTLRNIDRNRQNLTQDPNSPFHNPMLNAPQWLKDALSQDYGDQAKHIMTWLLKPPPLDIRLKHQDTIAAQKWAHDLSGHITPHGSIRYYEKIPQNTQEQNSGSITKLKGYHDGAWWVQDSAASVPAMLLTHPDNPSLNNTTLHNTGLHNTGLGGKTIIDCCAAPGGKTAQLAAMAQESMAQNKTHIIAIDHAEKRIEKLKRNMQRLKLNPQIITADARLWHPPQKVDAVLLDAPCSATGTIRRHPDILTRETPPDIAALNKLQTELLKQAAEWLKPGGILVYATCSLLKAEGEDIIKNPPQNLKPLPINAAEIPGLTTTPTEHGAIRLMPDALKIDQNPNIRQGNDAFFIARFIKI